MKVIFVYLLTNDYLCPSLICYAMSEEPKSIIGMDDEPLDVGLHHFNGGNLTPANPGEGKKMPSLRSLSIKDDDEEAPVVRKERKKGNLSSSKMTSIPGGPKRLSIYIDKKTFFFIKYICATRGLSAPALVRDAILGVLKMYKDEYEQFDSVYNEEQ